MKSKILYSVIFIITMNTYGQNINWRSLKSEQKHLFTINFGFDYASAVGLGYGYKLNSNIPIVLNAEMSMPFGQKITDDFKTKIGGQIEVLHISDFSTTIKAYSIFRRNGSEFNRLLNFGSEFSIVSGYYSPNWNVAGEFGFDKAIVTHVKHSDLMRQNNPDLKNGWYIPTGGNFSLGIQTSYSIGNNDLSLKLGTLIQQDLKSKPLLPYYTELAYTKRL